MYNVYFKKNHHLFRNVQGLSDKCFTNIEQNFKVYSRKVQYVYEKFTTCIEKCSSCIFLNVHGISKTYFTYVQKQINVY